MGGVSGMVYKQWSDAENGVNRWGRNVDPISLVGNASWINVTASVSVLIPKIKSSRSEAATLLPGGPLKYFAPNGTYVNWKNRHNDECLGLEPQSEQLGAWIDTRRCSSARMDTAFTFNPTTGQWRNEATKQCISTHGCSSETGLCLVPCGNNSDLWDWDPKDGTVRVRNNPDACLQTAKELLDSNVFVGSCSNPVTRQQQWDNIADQGHKKSSLASHTVDSCHRRSGDSCPGCTDKECCESYFVPATNGSERFNCIWSTAGSCSQSTQACDMNPSYAGLCVRTDRNGFGICLTLDHAGKWSLGTGLASGHIETDPSTSWTQLKIVASGRNVTAVINGVAYSADTAEFGSTPGMVSINSGFNVSIL